MDHNPRSLSELLNTELRRINASKLNKLSSIIGNNWKKLLEALTKPINVESSASKPRSYHLNFTLDAINLIEQQLLCGQSPALALLNHWSITGRRRPTIGILLRYLHLCNLRWAEDFVCKNILDIKSIEQLLPQPIEYKPSSTQEDPIIVVIEDQFEFDNLTEIIDNLNFDCTRYSFEAIYRSTNRFCHKPYDAIRQEGGKVGEGRFSSVYKAKTTPLDDNAQESTVAVKLLKSECNKKYLINEINLIAKVKHENILPLLGISLGSKDDTSRYNYICLIYPYMQNGSLLDCLSTGLVTRPAKKYLSWLERISITIKIARGITYLHSIPDGSIIHRDIKTANILIDSDVQPKLGDFTLVRQLDVSKNLADSSIGTTQFSQNIIGTSVYMPPEAFRGDISIKFDSFSFGIVILELLTGLKPFNEDEDTDLFTYITEKLSDISDCDFGNDESREVKAKDDFLMEVLDKKAGEWDFEKSKTLFQVALNSTESRRKDRPDVSSILPILESII